MVKISVIIPVYNVVRYLDKCLASVIGQTLEDIEIILVDDGSTDGSANRCDDWAEKDFRVRVIHKKNEGQSVARNTGLEFASGEYVAFVDADDYIELNTYEVMYNRCREKHLDVAYFSFNRVDLFGNIVGKINTIPANEFFLTPKDVSKLFLNIVGRSPQEYHLPQYTTSASMSLYRKSIIDDNQIRFVNVREIASEDMIFSMDFLLHSQRAACYADVFYHYFVNSASTTTTYNEKKYERMTRCLQEVERICKDNFNNTEYVPHFLSQILRIYKITMRYESKSNFPLFEKIKRIKEKCNSVWLKQLYENEDAKKYPLRERIYIRCMRYKIWPILLLIY